MAACGENGQARAGDGGGDLLMPVDGAHAVLRTREHQGGASDPREHVKGRASGRQGFGLACEHGVAEAAAHSVQNGEDGRITVRVREVVRFKLLAQHAVEVAGGHPRQLVAPGVAGGVLARGGVQRGEVRHPLRLLTQKRKRHNRTHRQPYQREPIRRVAQDIAGHVVHGVGPGQVAEPTVQTGVAQPRDLRGEHARVAHKAGEEDD